VSSWLGSLTEFETGQKKVVCEIVKLFSWFYLLPSFVKAIEGPQTLGQV